MESRPGKRVNVQLLIDRRVQEWEMRQPKELRATQKEKPITGPYIAISRAIGTHGRVIAERVADRLGWQYYEREIVEYIAKRTQVRETVVKSLGETHRDEIDNWMRSMVDDNVLAETTYARHLVAVIGTIAAHGKAVILGRGAQFILPPEAGLRVRLVGPAEYRIQAAMKDYRIPRQEAEKLIENSDRAQARFYRSLFRKDVHDPLAYDLVLNTSTIGADAAVDAIVCSLRGKLGEAI